MLSRTSHVKRIILKNIVFASNLQIGDAEYIHTTANVLAVKHSKKSYCTKEVTIWEKEADFAYKTPCPAIIEKINITSFNNNPKIYVNNIDAIAISTSAIFQVGNSSHIRLDSSVYFKDKTMQTDDAKGE